MGATYHGGFNMIKSQSITLVFISILLASSIAVADQSSLSEALTYNAITAKEKCSLDYLIYIETEKSFALGSENAQPKEKRNEFVECVKASKNKTKEDYQKLSKTLSKNKGGLDAAKAFYAKWLSIIDSIEASANETRNQYISRQNTNDQSLKELAAKLNIEVM